MNKFGLSLFKNSRQYSHGLFLRTYSISSEDLNKIEIFKEKRRKIDEFPSIKAYNLLRDDFKRLAKGQITPSVPKVPCYAEYLIIGGGIMGSSIAYAMKNRAPDSFDLMVVERDPKYTRSSSALSVGGIRQQFSLKENIALSLYSADFLRNVKQHLSILDDEPPDIQFQPNGYLFLATEAGVDQMIKNYRLQIELGAKVEILKPSQLKQRFPWLNVEGIKLGCLGFENEGWFDPWALLSAFKKKAVSLGANYVNGEVIGFEFENRAYVKGEGAEPMLRTNYVYLKDDVGDIHCVEFAFLVIAAGAYSAEIADMLNIGRGPGILNQPLPLEPRKRYVYVFNCENGPGIDMPLMIDPSGTYVRREGLGGRYICGRSPSPAEEPDVSNLEVDYNFFENSVWPALSHRVPAFECAKVSSAWAGYYDYNTFDQNVIFGSHPYFPNIYVATGFSGHGIQMAPAIGNAMMELLIDGAYTTIDLSRFCMDRVFTNRPLFEDNIV